MWVADGVDKKTTRPNACEAREEVISILSILSQPVGGDAEAESGSLTLFQWNGRSSSEPADVEEMNQTRRGSNQRNEWQADGNVETNVECVMEG